MESSPSAQLTLFVEDSRDCARTSAPQDEAREWPVRGLGCGASTGVLLANYDPASQSWRTSQHCLVEGLALFSETWPRSGMTVNGTAYQLPTLVPLTGEIGSGLWPTPRSCSAMAANITPEAIAKAPERFKTYPNLETAIAIRMWPTPRANGATGAGRGPNLQGGENLQTAVGGHLNPTWVEWLMGFPLGWTDLKPSETPSSRKSRK
jgi:hypothetical protein